MLILLLTVIAAGCGRNHNGLDQASDADGKLDAKRPAATNTVRTDGKESLVAGQSLDLLSTSPPARSLTSEAAFPPGIEPVPLGGPYTHQIGSASGADGLSWSRDPGVRLEHASVPCAVVTTNNQILLYYVDADRGPGKPESIGCALSADGIHFARQPFSISGLPTRKALDPCVIRDQAGQYRLYYLASSFAGDPAADPQAHEIHLAISTDGIRFQENAVVFAQSGLVDPDVIVFQEKWLMYVFDGHVTVIATSTDGRKFTSLQGLDLPGWGTPAPVLLANGHLRLYAFEQRKPTANLVGSFVSTDGLKWTAEPGARLHASATEQITDPFVIRWKDGYKMYFKISAPNVRAIPSAPVPIMEPVPGFDPKRSKPQ
jgi:hypothetical protein